MAVNGVMGFVIDSCTFSCAFSAYFEVIETRKRPNFPQICPKGHFSRLQRLEGLGGGGETSQPLEIRLFVWV